MACCGSFTYICSANFIGAVLIVETLFLLIELYFIATNDYFDLSFSAFYAFFLIFIGVAAIVFLVFYCKQDDLSYRKFLPLALILAIVGNILIICWVIIYICAIYEPGEQVIVQKQLSSS